MILLLSGAIAGTVITKRLIQEGYQLVAVPFREGDLKRAPRGGNRRVDIIDTERNKLSVLLEQKAIQAVLDLSGPFWDRGAKQVKEMCRRRGIPFLCYLPRVIETRGRGQIYPVLSWPEAAQCAADLGDTIFLTTGSYNLEHFLDTIKDQRVRVAVRITPEYKVMRKCQELGLGPRDIVAMQGPFSKEMNRATFKSYQASVIVTRESGRKGGMDTKISAAFSLGIPVVMIKHDQAGAGIVVRTSDEVVEKLESVL
ncbi:MAG: precorrin-6A reductase [Peptococcaceae bacterium]|nr:precorrin-6A reductase [Peptococcaceae bacterium]